MEYIAIDIETGVLDSVGMTDAERKEAALDYFKGEILGLAYWSPSQQGYITQLPAIKEKLIEFKNSKANLILQNGRFDQKWLMYKTGVWLACTFDTLIAASLLKLRPQSLSLQSLANFYLGLSPWKDDAMYDDMAKANQKDVAALAIYDCEVTYKLAKRITQQLREEDLYEFFHTFQMPLVNMLAKLEYTGFQINLEELQAQFEEANKTHAVLVQQMREKYAALEEAYRDYLGKKTQDEWQEERKEKIKEAEEKYGADPTRLAKRTSQIDAILTRRLEKARKEEINYSSPAQMLWLLKHLGLECRDYTGKETTGAAVLESLAGQHPFVDDLLKTREVEKLLGYYQKWKELVKPDGRIHAQYNADQSRIRTGRLSSSNPNMQQVPKGKPRELFVAPANHCLVIIDYAQIEPRVVAQLSQDENLINGFMEGHDFYSVLIKGVLNLKQSVEEIHATAKDTPYRNLGKVVGLSVLYGIGPSKLAVTLKNATKKEDIDFKKAREIIDNYFNAFPGLLELRTKVARSIESRGYVRNIFGRHVYVDAGDAGHLGVNSLVQSSASDLCLSSQIVLRKRLSKLKMQVRLVHLVHDEVIYEVPIGAEEEFLQVAKESMTSNVLETVKIGGEWVVPLEVEAKVGPTWAAKS